MKKSLLLCLSVFTMATTVISCSKDDDNENKQENNEALNSTSAEEIQKAVLSGVWQVEKWREGSETDFKNAETYGAYKFLDTKNREVYLMKNVLYSTWLYKITTIDGKAVILSYPNQEGYDKNEPSDISDVSIENGLLKIARRSSNHTELFRKYNTIDETKDLPPAD